MGLYGALVVQPATAGSGLATRARRSTTRPSWSSARSTRAQHAANPAASTCASSRRATPCINGQAHPDTAPIATAGGRTSCSATSTPAPVPLDGRARRRPDASSPSTAASSDGTRATTSPRRSAPARPPTRSSRCRPRRRGRRWRCTTPASRCTTATLPGRRDAHLLEVTGPGAAPTPRVRRPAASPVRGRTLTATVDDATTAAATVERGRVLPSTRRRRRRRDEGRRRRVRPVTEAVTATVAGPARDSTCCTSAGQDAAGNWGPFSSVLVTGADAVGPTTSAVLTPGHTNGTPARRAMRPATTPPPAARTSQAAEYFIDAAGSHGTGTRDDGQHGGAGRQPGAAIPAATLVRLAEGTHTVLDPRPGRPRQLGRTRSSVTLIVDRTARRPRGCPAAPTPNNGTMPVNGSRRGPGVGDHDRPARSTHQQRRCGRGLHRHGRRQRLGIPLTASDGLFNDATEGGYADIPLATVKALTNGTTRSSSTPGTPPGNWGATGIDDAARRQDGAESSAVGLTPNPTQRRPR